MMIKCQWFSAVYGLTGLKLLAYAKISIENFKNMLPTSFLFDFIEIFWRYGWNDSWKCASANCQKFKNIWVGSQVYALVTAPRVITVTVSY